MKLMASFGGVFFGQEVTDDNDTLSLDETDCVAEITKEMSFFPLAPNIVQQNLRSRGALKEFKLRFIKVASFCSDAQALLHHEIPRYITMPSHRLVLSLLTFPLL